MNHHAWLSWYFKDMVRENWECGSSGKVPDKKVQDPEVKPQYFPL
jgi:hypothetical protein